MSHYRSIFGAFVLAGSPLLAQTTPPSPTPSRDDPNRVICRREEVTGSLAGSRKVCMTRADWVLRARSAQDAGQGMQDAGRINSCGSSEPGKC